MTLTSSRMARIFFGKGPFVDSRLIKHTLLQYLLKSLGRELDVITKSAMEAHEAATHEDAKPENKYDTRGLEASYLAQGQAQRASELKVQLGQLERFNIREAQKDEPISIGSLIYTVDEEGLKKTYYLLPYGGGARFKIEGNEFQIISSKSPLGTALIGKFVGDEVHLQLNKNDKVIEVMSYS